ncbi:hypothetical protein HZY97_07705 [Sphingomonas sp. R-74633]|uniref:hypothetical protein n=1 Tax=Sphingomonas sp. R-74633 TaxID=2751188 RepID=UPI0015D2FF51|nr:hypothetical protein [Sphingomonas sp. R-74633]NYT40637.1 hypothetical protein [Sphingomonas sp. R-74633]
MSPLLAALLLAAGAQEVSETKGEAIIFTRTPTLCLCTSDGDCLRCSETSFTVSAAGKGHVRVKWRQDSRIDERDFAIAPAQFEALRVRLAPFMPGEARVSLDGPACKRTWTDGTYYDVEWRQDGQRRQLHFYTGCDAEAHAAMGEAIGRAFDTLPLTEAPRH